MQGKCTRCGKAYRALTAATQKRGLCPACEAEAGPGSATIEVPCPGCGRTYRVPASRAGRKGRCRECGATFEVGAPKVDARPRRSAVARRTEAKKSDPFTVCLVVLAVPVGIALLWLVISQGWAGRYFALFGDLAEAEIPRPIPGLLMLLLFFLGCIILIVMLAVSLLIPAALMLPVAYLTERIRKARGLPSDSVEAGKGGRP